MSGIVGSRLNHRGSGVVGALGTDGQLLTSAGAGKSAVYEAAPAGFDVSTITGSTALGAVPATTDEFVISDAGTLKRVDFDYIKGQHRYAFSVYNGDAINITSNTTYVMPLNSEIYDPDSVFTNTAGNYKWTCPESGKYFFCASFHPYLANTGMAEATLAVVENGSSWTRWGNSWSSITHATTAGNNANLAQSINNTNQWIEDYTAGDYLQLKISVYIYAGTTTTANVTYSGNHFMGWRVD